MDYLIYLPFISWHDTKDYGTSVAKNAMNECCAIYEESQVICCVSDHITRIDLNRRYLCPPEWCS